MQQQPPLLGRCGYRWLPSMYCANLALMASDFDDTDTTLAMLCVMGAGHASETLSMAIQLNLPRLIIYVDHGELASNLIVLGDLSMSTVDHVYTYSSVTPVIHTEPSPSLSANSTDSLQTVHKASQIARKCLLSASALRAVCRSSMAISLSAKRQKL